jgi:hypothetical protein
LYKNIGEGFVRVFLVLATIIVMSRVSPYVYDRSFADAVTFVPDRRDAIKGEWHVAVKPPTAGEPTLLRQTHTGNIKFLHIVDPDTIALDQLPTASCVGTLSDNVDEDDDEEEESKGNVSRVDKTLNEATAYAFALWIQHTSNHQITKYTNGDLDAIRLYAASILFYAFRDEWITKENAYTRIGNEEGWKRLCRFAHVILGSVFAYERKVGADRVTFSKKDRNSFIHAHIHALKATESNPTDAARLCHYAIKSNVEFDSDSSSSASKTPATLVCVRGDIAWLYNPPTSDEFVGVCSVDDLIANGCYTPPTPLKWSMSPPEDGLWDRVWLSTSDDYCLPYEMIQDLSSRKTGKTSLLQLLANQVVWMAVQEKPL